MSAAMGAAMFAATGVYAPTGGGRNGAPLGPLQKYEIAPGHHVEEWSVYVSCSSSPHSEPHWHGTRHLFFTKWRLRRDLRIHLWREGVHS